MCNICNVFKSLSRLAILPLLVAVGTSPAAIDTESQTVTLPIVMAPSAVVMVTDEDDLRNAIASANTAGQLPRIELQADIDLTAPLPVLENPGAGTAVIAGNGHSLDGHQTGTVLAIGPSTTVVVESLTIRGGVGSHGPFGDCGGGIFSAGRLIVRQSEIADNVASRGGAICLWTNDNPLDLTIEDTKLSDNAADQYGGALFVQADGPTDVCPPALADVTVISSRIERNSAENAGGGVFALSAGSKIHLRIIDSVLADNRVAAGPGGAVYTEAGNEWLTASLYRSAIVDNTATQAGGWYNLGKTGICWYCGARAQVRIVNSTFSGNRASGYGGALLNRSEESPFPLGSNVLPWVPQDPPPTGGGHVEVLYSTITGNSAQEGSGIWREAGVFLVASIVAGNAAGGGDCNQTGWTQTGGYNLDGDGTCGFTAATDVPQGMPDLLPLNLNAPGKTPTHALGPASQARNRIPWGESGCDQATATDQRGVVRPQPARGRCDIGAYEVILP